MTESAKQQGRGHMIPVNNIGERFVENFLNGYTKEDQIAILNGLATSESRALNMHLANFAESVFLSTARLEGVTDELVMHARTQAMTLRSVFLALAHNGQLMASEEHPLLRESKAGEQAETALSE